MTRQQRFEQYRKLIQSEDEDDDMEEKEDEANIEYYNAELGGTEKITANDFQMISVLGRGAFGKVMEVRHTKTGRSYAMKILRKQDIIAKKQEEHTNTEREMLAAMQHPFLMGLKYAFQSPSKLYFVLDYYPGGELFFHLQQKRSFPEKTTCIWVAEVALALGHLHKSGYIYRDLKPENIVLGMDGHVCLTDFGLAKSFRGNKDLTYSFVGTPEYLAPEIIKTDGHNKDVDWWSLGILLFELCNGLPPFYSKNARDMYQKILNAPIRFKESKGPFSNLYRECVAALLRRDVTKRLGYKNDVEEVMGHGFFASLDREKLMAKAIPTNFLPSNKQKNVAKEFQKEKAILSKAPTPMLSEGKDAFLGFTYNASNTLSALAEGNG